MRTTLGARAGATALLLTVLVACTSSKDDEVDPPPTPDEVAAGLATALQSGDVSTVTFAGADSAATQTSYAAVLGDLAEVARTVAVGTVTVDEPPAGTDAPTRAAATLTWSWPLAAETWTYETDVELEQAGDQWQTQWSPEVVEPGLADDETLALSSVEGARGRVLGAGGEVLVTDRPVQRIGIDKPQLTTDDEVRSSARALARLVGVDVTAYVGQVAAAGAQAFVEAISYRQDELPLAVEAGLAGIPGVRSVAAQQALAPTRDFAAAILGRVGPVTEDMVEQDPEAYQPGDVAGLSGLQARYDEQLRGSPTVLVRAVNPAGEARELFRSAPTPGADVTLTLDQRLQSAAEGLLATVGPASAIVAVRPSTGEVLAAANGPGNGGQNLATFGQYAPGSTFKIVSTLALLRAGLTPGSTVPCTPTITVDGRVFGNYSDYPASGIGAIALRTAVANSCNTAFISQVGVVPNDALTSAANALGLGIDHEVGYPAFFGTIDPPASETQAAADLIGQGTVLASPMTMAAVIASVQQGAAVVPRLVTAPAPADTAAAPAAPLNAGEAESLRAMLRGVVTDGSASALADLPGVPVLAKTGTAEFGTPGADGELQTHAWMVAAQGDLAVAVFVDIGASGSRTAGPIIEDFLRAAQ